MLLNLCIIGLLALIFNAILEKLKLPGLLGMLIIGMAMGPNALDLMNPVLMEVSMELREFALIVILLRAGLGLRKKELNRVGKSAIKMSFIPGLCEGAAIIAIAYFVLNFNIYEAGILGFTIAAVSPAVVVPQMLELKGKGIGKDKEIPTLVLAGASLDDVFAITIFSAFLSMYFNDSVNLLKQFVEIPVSILFGIAIGIVIGVGLIVMYRRLKIRDTKKVLILLSVSILFNQIDDFVWANSLLGIMAIGFILLEYMPAVANRLSAKMDKVWVFAEIILFVLIGAQVDFTVALQTGAIGFVIIGVGLSARSMGVFISLLGSELNYKERLFCVFSYFPKATVQAAIGAVPLSMGVAHGEEILAIAVLSILVTAPVGAIAIRISAPKLLTRES
jgi:NhaP-type Na+/H+ or K+/H+ antiporter